MGSVGSSSPSSSGPSSSSSSGGSSSSANKNDDNKSNKSGSSKSSTSQTTASSEKSEPSQTGSSVSFNDVMASAAGAKAAESSESTAPSSTPSTSTGSTSFGDTTPNYTGPVNDPRGPALSGGNSDDNDPTNKPSASAGGLPPSDTTPNYTGPVNDPRGPALSGGDETDPTRAAGPPGIAAAPSTATFDPGLTPEQSEALAQRAAVMQGANPIGGGWLEGTMANYAYSQQLQAEAYGDAGEFAGRAALGVGKAAIDVVAGAADLAWEGVKAVTDWPGAATNMLARQVGFEPFPGAEERYWGREEAIVDFVNSVPDMPGQIADSIQADWVDFKDDLRNGRHGDAGETFGRYSFEVATVAVPVAKGVSLSRVEKIDDVAVTTTNFDTLDPKTFGPDIVFRSGDNLPPTLYRGDSRSPEQITDDLGFQPKGPNTDLYDYAKDNTPSVFVGASEDVNIAIDFATDFGKRDGYVYAIDPRRGGIDVNASLPQTGRRLSPFPIEQEIAFPGGIPIEDVRGSSPIDQNRVFGDSSTLNPEYRHGLDFDD